MDKGKKRVSQFTSLAFLTHGGAGAISKFILAPIDRLKIMAQLNLLNLSPMKSVQATVNNQKWTSLWWGSRANVISGVSSTGIRIATEYSIVAPLIYQSSFIWKFSIYGSIFSSISCSVAAMSLVYPLDVIHTRMAGRALQEKPLKRFSTALFPSSYTKDTRSVMKSLLLAYRGFSISLLTIVPFTILSNCLIHSYGNSFTNSVTHYYQKMDLEKRKILKKLGRYKDTDEELDKIWKDLAMSNSGESEAGEIKNLYPFSPIVLGLCVGTFCQFAFYPLDTIRRNYIVQGGERSLRDFVKQEYSLFLQAKKLENTRIAQLNFTRDLYRGSSYLLIKCIPEIFIFSAVFYCAKNIIGF